MATSILCLSVTSTIPQLAAATELDVGGAVAHVEERHVSAVPRDAGVDPRVDDLLDASGPGFVGPAFVRGSRFDRCERVVQAMATDHFTS